MTSSRLIDIFAALNKTQDELRDAINRAEKAEAVLRIVRDMVKNGYRCRLNHKLLPSPDVMCDGDDCIRCAVIDQIGRVLGEEKAHV